VRATSFFVQLRMLPSACLLAWFLMPTSDALAQREQMSLPDQPGYVPRAEDEQLPPQFQRQLVFYRSSEAPGTIIIHTSERSLYVVQPNGRALRYGIGVGRDGFQWQGLLHITRKQEWPDWTPPPEMIQRQPYLPRFMAGGPGNPRGRALSISARHGLSHSRHESAANDRQRGFVGMLPFGQQRCDPPL
jgi:lipoprotein-anchoring transpeptidase ErfK/SrfK